MAASISYAFWAEKLGPAIIYELNLETQGQIVGSGGSQNGYVYKKERVNIPVFTSS